MQGHIPDNGTAFIVYGPHIGIDSDGLLGQIERRGRHDETPCCGSAAAAARYVMQQPISRSKQKYGTSTEQASPLSRMDMEQSQVNALLMPYKDQLGKSVNPFLELPYILFGLQDTMLRQIIQMAGLKTKVALLGGIQINTPAGEADYFCPLAFDILDMTKGQTQMNLLDDLFRLQ
jgi:hypothetical protein